MGMKPDAIIPEDKGYQSAVDQRFHPDDTPEEGGADHDA